MNSEVVSGIGLHTHDDKVSNPALRKYSTWGLHEDNVLERPAKLARSAVRKQDTDDDKEVTVSDVRNRRAVIYRQRIERSTLVHYPIVVTPSTSWFLPLV